MNIFAWILCVRGNWGKGHLAVGVRLEANVLLQVQLPREDVALFGPLSLLPIQDISTSTTVQGSHCKGSLLCASFCVCIIHLCSLEWFWVEEVGNHPASSDVGLKGKICPVWWVSMKCTYWCWHLPRIDDSLLVMLLTLLVRELENYTDRFEIQGWTSERAVAAESEQEVKLSGRGIRDEQGHIGQSWGLETGRVTIYF